MGVQDWIDYLGGNYMVKIFLSLMFLAHVVAGIWMVYSFKGMGRDLYKIKDELNEIEKEMREVK